MRLEDIRACEGIMRDVPKMKMSLVMMERASMGGASWDAERVQSGPSLPAAVRLSENELRSGVLDVLDRIEGAIKKLNREERDVVINVYFLGLRHEDAASRLHMTRRTVARWCRNIVERIAPKILPLYGKVIGWRQVYEDEIVRTWTQVI